MNEMSVSLGNSLQTYLKSDSSTQEKGEVSLFCACVSEELSQCPNEEEDCCACCDSGEAEETEYEVYQRTKSSMVEESITMGYIKTPEELALEHKREQDRLLRELWQTRTQQRQETEASHWSQKEEKEYYNRESDNTPEQ